MISESKFPIKVAKEKSRPQCGRAHGVDRPNTSSIIFTGNLSDFYSSDLGTSQVETNNYGLTDLSDGIIKGKGRNSS